MPEFHEPRRPGRPKGDGNCADCRREGVYTPKKYGSYCGRHSYIRQRTSKSITSNQREYIVGDWQYCNKNASESLISRLEREVTSPSIVLPARTMKAGERLAETFEYACVLQAVKLGRRMTVDEENDIIGRFQGDRFGISYADADWGPRNMDPPLKGPLLLPDPQTRLRFRAMRNGGPTCVNEGEFEDYYRMQFQQDPPDEWLTRSLPKGPAIVLPEVEWVNVEGLEVHRDVADEVRAALKSGTLLLEGIHKEQHDAWLAAQEPKGPVDVQGGPEPDMDEDDDVLGYAPEHYVPSDPAAIASFSSLGVPQFADEKKDDDWIDYGNDDGDH